MVDYVVYTDGACSGNPGPGGWAALLRDCADNYEWSVGGAEKLTTNNRMELIAAISAIEQLPEGCNIDLYTDSEYLQKGASKWMYSWERSGLFDQSKPPRRKIKNLDLWRQIIKLCRSYNIQWMWVKGHSGVYGNETADKLAQEQLKNQPA